MAELAGEEHERRQPALPATAWTAITVVPALLSTATVTIATAITEIPACYTVGRGGSTTTTTTATTEATATTTTSNNSISRRSKRIDRTTTTTTISSNSNSSSRSCRPHVATSSNGKTVRHSSQVSLGMGTEAVAGVTAETIEIERGTGMEPRGTEGERRGGQALVAVPLREHRPLEAK